MTFRGWMNIIKTCLITLAPLYVPVLLLAFFRFDIQSILASILFIQIYVMVIQAEAMNRQAAWGKAAYAPTFGVETSVTIEIVRVKVKNIGDKPAYNFAVGLRDDTEGKRIPYVTKEQELVRSLYPNEEADLFLSISAEEFFKRRIILTILCETVLGHTYETRAISFEKTNDFLMMPIPVEPGFLLKAYEDLALYFRWRFTYKKLLRK